MGELAKEERAQAILARLAREQEQLAEFVKGLEAERNFICPHHANPTLAPHSLVLEKGGARYVCNYCHIPRRTSIRFMDCKTCGERTIHMEFDEDSRKLKCRTCGAIYGEKRNRALPKP